MKFTIEKNRLAQSLELVSRGLSRQSTLPVLSGVHINATADGVVFETSDLETSVRHQEDALIEEPGAIVAPGKLFFDIVKSLPEAAVELALDSDQLLINCQGAHFRVSTMNPIDFPQFPQVVPSRSVELPTTLLQQMVKRVVRSVSRENNRPVLAGVFFQVEESKLRLVATDSYRLAISTADLTQPGTAQAATSAVKPPANASAGADSVADSKPDVAASSTDAETPATNKPEFATSLEMIIPGLLLEDICRIAGDTASLTIGEAENQIIFRFGSTTFISRKIEGNYPNYEQIIPTQKTVTVTVETEVLLSAVKRVSVVAKNNTPVRFLLHPEVQLLEVRASAQDVGEASESLVAQIDGEGLEMGFNHQYILDGLTAADAKEIVFEAQTPVKPGIFKTLDSSDYFYLTMPVRLDH
ncbi:MAG: DNA polymerase III subunit beta [Coriobacteriales bacterium]|jgi:DNA polymerase-3 subunit beta|nr:DNA polymerase III subunit beta [Coriobacteriales bacterium]